MKQHLILSLRLALTCGCGCGCGCCSWQRRQQQRPVNVAHTEQMQTAHHIWSRDESVYHERIRKLFLLISALCGLSNNLSPNQSKTPLFYQKLKSNFINYQNGILMEKIHLCLLRPWANESLVQVLKAQPPCQGVSHVLSLC